MSKYVKQKRRVYKAFQSSPKTMLQVSEETGIMRANICRFVGEWKKQDAIKIAYKGICPITKMGGVQFLTTDLIE